MTLKGNPRGGRPTRPYVVTVKSMHFSVIKTASTKRQSRWPLSEGPCMGNIVTYPNNASGYNKRGPSSLGLWMGRRPETPGRQPGYMTLGLKDT